MLVRYSRNGALRFLRIGRVQLSFCICKRTKPARRYDGQMLFADGLIAITLGAAVLATLI